MHSQAAFVPSYDQANFNLMPGLPLLLGSFEKLGFLKIFAPPLAIKVISALAWIAWAWLLWKWAFEALSQLQGKNRLNQKQIWINSSLFGLAPLWVPTIRWGTLVVRTETWVGLCWIL